MKEIKVYEFNELPSDIKAKIIAANMAYVAKQAFTYINEIWTDHVHEADFSQYGFRIDTTVKETLTFASCNVALNNSAYINEINRCSYDERKALLLEIADKLDEISYWYTEEFRHEVKFYNGDPFYVFITKFFQNIGHEAWIWLIQMTNNVEFAIEYITGKRDSDFADTDSFFQDWNFTAEGLRIDIK